MRVDVIASEGESHVIGNMQRKAKAAEEMFAMLVKHMNNALHLHRTNGSIKVKLPQFLKP